MNRRKKIQKLVERRATKNRKLRFKTFEKLENFMSSKENINILPDRDSLIANLFGKRYEKNEVVAQPEDIDLL